MRAANVSEVGATAVAVDLLLETLLIAVADGVVEGAPFSSPAAPTASCTAASAPSSTVAASTTAVLLPVGFPPHVRSLLLAVVPWAFVPVGAVLAAVEALYLAGVTLRTHGNPAAHNWFAARRGASQVVSLDIP